jgi:hypothetical protein
MPSFGNLSKLRVKQGVTAEFTLYMLSPPSVLVVRPADETNKEYLTASLKNSRERARMAQRTGVTPGLIEANRNRDRVNYAAHVVTDWRSVTDDAGKDVPFTKDNCREFLEALPDWIFDEVREFCQAPSNFTETPDEEDLGN